MAAVFAASVSGRAVAQSGGPVGTGRGGDRAGQYGGPVGIGFGSQHSGGGPVGAGYGGNKGGSRGGRSDPAGLGGV